MPGPPQSRKAFLRTAGLGTAAGTTVLLSACGGSSKDSSPDRGGPDGGASPDDVRILNSALDMENVAASTYRAVAGELRGSAQAIAKLFAEQEQEHADGLAQAIRDLGGVPSERRSQGALTVRGSTRRQVLDQTVRLENRAIAAYLDALPKLSSPDLRGTTAAILTSEAEHLSVLLGELGEPAVPQAFVTGKRRRA